MQIEHDNHRGSTHHYFFWFKRLIGVSNCSSDSIDYFGMNAENRVCCFGQKLMAMPLKTTNRAFYDNIKLRGSMYSSAAAFTTANTSFQTR